MTTKNLEYTRDKPRPTQVPHLDFYLGIDLVRDHKPQMTRLAPCMLQTREKMIAERGRTSNASQGGQKERRG